MRTFKSMLNIIIALVMGVVVIVANFVAQRFFISILGIEYAGLNSLFTNIISMLAVAELGLGASIVYHLYKPLHEKNISTTSSIMRFYRNGYRIIALVISTIAVALIPIIPLIVGSQDMSINITAVYLLFVLGAVFSYVLSYKRSLLYADQNNYIVNAVHLGALVLLNAAQICVLLATKNYYLYLILKIIFVILENITIGHIVDKSYKLDKNPKKISKELRSDIFTKIKGLIFHKVGSFVILGSTSIMISTTLGLTTVGLYSNYLIIQAAITSLLSQVSTAIRASIGNLLVDKGGKASFKVFERLQFANQILAIILTSLFLIASSSIVRVWLGDDYILNAWVILACSVNLYLTLTRSVFANFKEAAGIFYEDRFVPLVEAIINIVASLIMIHLFGLAGAFMGTALSSVALHGYSYPKYVYKGVFSKSYGHYAVHILKNVSMAVLTIGVAYLLSSILKVDRAFANLALSVLISILVPVAILWAVYRKSDEYRYFVSLVGKVVKHKKRSK